MFNPKTPLQAAAIFLTGIAVIGWTTWDISRVQRQNQPMTPEQIEQMKEYIESSKRQAAGLTLAVY